MCVCHLLWEEWDELCTDNIQPLGNLSLKDKKVLPRWVKHKYTLKNNKYTFTSQQTHTHTAVSLRTSVVNISAAYIWSMKMETLPGSLAKIFMYSICCGLSQPTHGVCVCVCVLLEVSDSFCGCVSVSICSTTISSKHFLPPPPLLHLLPLFHSISLSLLLHPTLGPFLS